MWSTINFSFDFNCTILMNPWMAEVFSMADFIEIDDTFKVSPELSYLLNVVTFNYNTCKCKWHSSVCVWLYPSHIH